jgi:hypothetical protein
LLPWQEVWVGRSALPGGMLTSESWRAGQEGCPLTRDTAQEEGHVPGLGIKARALLGRDLDKVH